MTFVNPETIASYSNSTTSDGATSFISAYSFDAEVPLSQSAAYDLWVQGIWVQGGFAAIKPPVTLEIPGEGRGRKGCLRSLLGGVVREKILDAGAPNGNPSAIATVLYTIVSFPLPFREYKSLVEFIPLPPINGEPRTLVRWSGKLAPKAWDVFGILCWAVSIFFTLAVGSMLSGLRTQAVKTKNQ
ncbi:hypothetical protein THRCLA_20881 [Thraustotheca clavata]|uniref:Uncharacterized protein n=1 Tax=Thraustotheca clavata TaxID=74557 RepID=A0A1W0A2G1_9STRA|nr:hypothetical protein THRCLA_20881 [Thraustotheca clavata]